MSPSATKMEKGRPKCIFIMLCLETAQDIQLLCSYRLFYPKYLLQAEDEIYLDMSG